MPWIDKTASGTLRLRERFQIDGKWKCISVPLEKDTPQARRKASEALEEKKKVILRPVEQKSLKSLMELYEAKKICKASSRKNTQNSLNGIYKIIGEVPLDPAQINHKVMESNVKASTINNYLVIFRAFCRWCFKYGYLTEEIASRIVNIPDQKVKKDPDLKYLEKEELAAALDQLSGMYFYLSKFLVLTGCRIGEATALTLDDIDQDYVHVTRTLDEHGSRSAKTRSSVRDVSIQPELSDLIKEYKQWRLLYMMSKGFRTDLLFFNTRGNHILRNEYNRALGRIKGPKHIHAHMFRHTHVALLAEQGIPLEVISRRLGHEDSRITKEIYFHVTEKMKQKDAEMIAKVRIL